MTKVVTKAENYLKNGETILTITTQWGEVLMDLSKAFDCIPHDLLTAKLSAYGRNGNALKYIYTYLKKRKQCVRVNNVCSDFKDIISGVLQGLIVGPMLLNAFLSDFFFCIRKMSVHNFADDNTLSSFAKSVTLLVEILTTESQNAIKWFSKNKMIVNLKILNQLLFRTVVKQANLDSF